MGFVAEVVEFLRSLVNGAQVPEVKVDRGVDPMTCHHYAPPGDDSRPLPGDDAFLVASEGAGAALAVGYQDPASAPVAGAGEKRIYSRSGPGVMACEVWLRADGTLRIRNLLGSIELAPSGAINASNAVGGVAVSAAGVVTFTTPLGTFGAATHLHVSPFGPTGAPIPGT